MYLNHPHSPTFEINFFPLRKVADGGATSRDVQLGAEPPPLSKFLVVITQ